MKKGGLAIILGGGPMSKHGPSPMGKDDAEEDTTSACDIALEDAFRAIKKGDVAAFKEAMRDAILAAGSGEDDDSED